jgi:hypothetical protein
MDRPDKLQLEAAALGTLWRETTPSGRSTLFMRTRQGGMHGLLAIATNDYDLDEAMGEFISFEAEDWEIITPGGLAFAYEQMGVVAAVAELLSRGE